jgi:TM2 domain-containing membrane protein YozV
MAAAPIAADPATMAAPMAAPAAVMEVTPTTAAPMAAAPIAGAAPLMTGATMGAMPMGQVMAGQTGGKSKVIAGILAILLGGIGVHKFYMGKIGKGILYLVFCWTMIPSLIGLIEGIMYLVQDEEKFHARYA